MAWLIRPFYTLVRMQRSALKTPTIFPRVFSTTSAQTITDSQPLPFSSLPSITQRENMLAILRNGVDNYHRLSAERFEKYGPIYKETAPDGGPIVHICDPDDFEKVFRADKLPTLRPNFVNSVGYFVEKGLPEGILGNDEHAPRHRAAISPLLLKPNELKEYVPSLFEVAYDTVSQLKTGRNENLFEHFIKCSTESIAVVTFGRRIGVNAENPNEKVLAFIHAVCGLFDTEAKILFSLPFYKYFKTPSIRQLYRAMDVIWSLTNEYVEEEKANPAKNEALIGSLQKMMKDERNILSDKEIIQMASHLFGGGVDTTAITNVNVLNNLSQNSRVQEKLYEEIRHVLPNKKKPKYEDLDNMPYLKSVMYENFRVNPTGPGFLRAFREPIILSGYEIPANVKINVSTITSKEMARVAYGDDYESFKPERWLRGNTTKLHPFASVPFGFGSRKCIGRLVTQTETQLLLINMLRCFKIEKSFLEEDKLTWKFNLTIKPANPFNLTLKKRN